MRYRYLACSSALLLALLVCGTGRAAPATTGRLVVTVPGDQFTVWLEYQDAQGAAQTTPPVLAAAGKATIPLPAPPAQVRQPLLVALDAATGNVALKPVTLKPGKETAVTLAAADISAVELLRVRVTGSDGQPAESGTVSLTDSQGRTRTQSLLPRGEGMVEFSRVPFGKMALKAVFADGSSLTQESELKPDHAPGAVVVELAKATPAGAKETAPGNAPPAPEVELPADAKDAPANTPAPAPSGPGGVASLVGLVLLAAVGYVGYRVLKDRGTTAAGVLQKLGIQLPSDEPAAQPARPAAPPPPLVPEGCCPYCGQPKDATTGECACSVTTAPAAAPAAAGSQQGPRLVVMQGPALGRSFALADTVLMIGRAAESDISLPEDNTVSRRHASLAPEGNAFLLRDQGSANGTFVNGMRVTERVLQPGDEIQVGSTRLRYEA